MFFEIKKYKYYFLFAFVITALTLIALSIFIINSKIYPSQVRTLTGYESLKNSVMQLGKDQNLSKFGTYSGLKNDIFSLSNPQLKDEEIYNTLLTSEVRIGMIYEDTNSHMLYNFNEELKKFTKNNFPKLYKESKFTLTCSDSECATTQAKEILEIANIINSSTLSAEIKKSDAQLFTTLSYINKDEAELRVKNIYGTALGIKSDDDYKNAGINIQIYNKVINFLINKYPTELKKISNVKDLEKLR